MADMLFKIRVFLGKCVRTYSKLNPRLLALFVFLAAAGAIFFYGFNTLVKNVSSVAVNIEGPKVATVSLLKAGAKILSIQCEGRCVLNGVPAFDYELSVESDGYVKQARKIQVRNKSEISESFTLVRDVKTVEYRSERSEALSDLKSKRRILSESGAVEAGRQYLGNFADRDYFTESRPAFRVVSRDGASEKDKELYLAPSSASPLVVFNASEGLLWVESAGSTLFLDLVSSGAKYPPLPSGISKVARTPIKDRFIVADDKDSYTYDALTGQFQRNLAYGDFVVFSNGKIVGLVRKGDTYRANLLNLPDDGSSYLVVDVQGQPRKTVFVTQENIKRLFLDGFELVLEFEDGRKESLKNYD